MSYLLKYEYVKRRQWLDDAAYAELLTLCQFVPGPSENLEIYPCTLRIEFHLWNNACNR